MFENLDYEGEHWYNYKRRSDVIVFGIDISVLRDFKFYACESAAYGYCALDKYKDRRI